jgi:hypothetical protein
MKRALLVVGVVLSSLPIPWADVAHGDPPDILRSYRFLPRHSTLEQTGGIAGLDIHYSVFGSFDLVTGWEYVYDPKPISIHPFARFENVDAWAGNPLTASAQLDLDRILNMSGLEGSQLPVAAPFDVFKFEGTTDDGSAVTLFASLIRRWLYLRGGTEPPPESADFFTYQINALARQRPFADFNQDDAVDGGDLTTWASHFGPAPAAAGDLLGSGDANSDGVVDGADFLLWQQQVGEAPPAMESLDGILNGALATLPVASAVPEPEALGLAVVGALLFTAPRRSK